MPGPPADEVRARLIDWCGHAPEELVTWFSTINGIVPGATDWGNHVLIGTFKPVSLDRAIRWTRARVAASDPTSPLQQWQTTHIKIMVTDPATLYVHADADPVVAPVWHKHGDDDQRMIGEPLTGSIEELVGLWLHLFDYGMNYDPDRGALAWLLEPDDPTGLDPRAVQAAYQATSFGANLWIEQFHREASNHPHEP